MSENKDMTTLVVAEDFIYKNVFYKKGLVRHVTYCHEEKIFKIEGGLTLNVEELQSSPMLRPTPEFEEDFRALINKALGIGEFEEKPTSIVAPICYLEDRLNAVSVSVNADFELEGKVFDYLEAEKDSDSHYLIHDRHIDEVVLEVSYVSTDAKVFLVFESVRDALLKLGFLNDDVVASDCYLRLSVDEDRLGRLLLRSDSFRSFNVRFKVKGLVAFC